MQPRSNCAQCISRPEKLTRVMDYLGIGASALCAVHCFLLPILMVALSVLGIHSFSFSHDMTHRWLAFLVLAFCLAAIIPGYLKHKNKRIVILMATGITLVMFATFMAASQFGEASEFPLITTGNALVIAAHLLNRRSLKAKSSITLSTVN